MIRLELIDEKNIEYAIKIQNKIFPEYNGKRNYYGSLGEYSQTKYFLIYDDNTCIGTTGLYYYKNDFDNAWLGFFGFLEEYRNKGYGTVALKLTEDYMHNIGFKFVRLFTDRLGNDIAINFYKKNGYIFENYDCKLEELKDLFDVVIGSKSLTGGYVPKWNNKFINISKQTKKQMN
ncbi:MAG: GNAT family N-acetyltransferase [Acholeplasmatales bacterium]|nr:GNAT family N-acetyltransferase [Acholeplasmatales bacterium]